MTTKEKEILQPKQGPAWKNSRTFESWEKAAEKRDALIKEWKEKKVDRMQVKVKRRADGFVVKTRLDPSASKTQPAAKKRGKRKESKKIS